MLKLLKMRARSWNCEVSEKLDLGVKEEIKDLNTLDQSLENDNVRYWSKVADKRVEARNLVWQNL